MTGIATISIELELGWGMHDKDEYSHLSSNAQPEFEAITFLLDLCDSYHVPITFDIVGHLFHDNCSGDHEGPYPNTWWEQDPGTDAMEDPLFYCPDLIDTILNADVDHEICTHTYSHMLCEEMDESVLNHELTLVEEIHEKFGLNKPTSIVTPRHQSPSYEILDNHGIDTIRTPFPSYTPVTWKSKLGSFGSFLWIFSRQHPMTELNSSQGLTETYSTPYPSLTSGTLPIGQRSQHPAFQLIPRTIRQKAHGYYLRSAIDKAADLDKHVHFWTHTFNLVNDAQHPGVRNGIMHLAKKRDHGEIAIKKMNELSKVMNGGR